MKRNVYLQPISREHHHSLLLCWKIRAGFSKGIEVERMKKYADWFFKNHVQPHFEVEEKYIFPILGNENELVKKALSEHRRLTRLFENNDEIEKSLSLIEEELESHIRFEERTLFNEIQKMATEEQLKLMAELHTEKNFQENTQDEFWK
jgi:iron-sulfur cluster repair protein YtfE (RIC family)